MLEERQEVTEPREKFAGQNSRETERSGKQPEQAGEPPKGGGRGGRVEGSSMNLKDSWEGDGERRGTHTKEDHSPPPSNEHIRREQRWNVFFVMGRWGCELAADARKELYSGRCPSSAFHSMFRGFQMENA